MWCSGCHWSVSHSQVPLWATIRFCVSSQSGKWLHYDRVPQHYGRALQRPPCNTIQHYTTLHCMQDYATLCNTMQHYATLCNTMQHNPTLCNTMHYATQHYATLCKCNPCCCNTVQNASTVTVILSPMQAMYYNVRIQSIVWQCTINADLQESVNTTCWLQSWLLDNAATKVLSPAREGLLLIFVQ